MVPRESESSLTYINLQKQNNNKQELTPQALSPQNNSTSGLCQIAGRTLKLCGSYASCPPASVTRKKFHRIPSRKQQWRPIICDLNIAIHYLTVVSRFPDRGNAHDFLEVILNTQFLVQLWQDNVTPGCPSALSCGFPASLGLKLISQPAGQLSH